MIVVREWLDDLVEIRMPSEDVILGMDWLIQFRAVIDMSARSLTMTAPDGTQHQVWVTDRRRTGEVICLMQAIQLVRVGCEGYLCI